MRQLNLRETTPTTLNALYSSFRDEWFANFKSMTREEIEVEDEKGKMKKVPHPDSVAAWAIANGVNVAAAEGLHDKLRRLFGKPYIVEKPAADSVKEIIGSLENGQHVVLSFGEHGSDLDYLLVSVGSYIGLELARQGHEVLAYDSFCNYASGVRSGYHTCVQKRMMMIKDTVSIARGDVRDAKRLTRAMRDFRPDVVINLVGILNERVHDGSGFRRAHVEFPRKVIEACRSNGIERPLHMSALGADAFTVPATTSAPRVRAKTWCSNRVCMSPPSAPR